MFVTSVSVSFIFHDTPYFDCQAKYPYDRLLLGQSLANHRTCGVGTHAHPQKALKSSLVQLAYVHRTMHQSERSKNSDENSLVHGSTGHSLPIYHAVVEQYASTRLPLTGDSDSQLAHKINGVPLTICAQMVYQLVDGAPTV